MTSDALFPLGHAPEVHSCAKKSSGLDVCVSVCPCVGQGWGQGSKVVCLGFELKTFQFQKRSQKFLL